MQERRMEPAKRSVDQVSDEIRRETDNFLGIPVLYQVVLMPESEYSARRLLDDHNPSGISTAYINHNEGSVFVNRDRVGSISETALAGWLIFYAVEYFAFKNFNQKRKQDFRQAFTLGGVAEYAQSILKEELHLKLGYYLDLDEEKRKRENFFSKRPPSAIIGREVAERLHEESGQSRIIWPIVLRASNSENFDFEIHEMDKEYYVTMLRKCPPEIREHVKIDESKSTKIVENEKTIAHLFFQKREFRDATPYLENLAELLDPDLDKEEKFHLLDILERAEEKNDDSEDKMEKIEPTLKLEYLPEKTIIQNDLISIDMRYNRPTLENVNAKDEEDRKKHAIIQ
jgi:hypothetical protein